MAADVELMTTEETASACDCANIKTILRSEFKCSNFCFSHPTPHLLASNQWGFSTFVYLHWRIFWAVFYMFLCTYVVIDKAFTYPTLKAVWFFYLSTWAHLLLTVSTIVQALVVAYVVLRSISIGEGTPWYLKVAWFLYTLSTDIYLEVTVLYLHFARLGNASVAMGLSYLGNSVYILLDMAVTATPVRLFHLVYTVAFYSLYITATAMFWGAGGTNERGEPYACSPLDLMLAQRPASLVVVWLVCGAPAAHLVVWTFYVLRRWAYCKRKFRGA